MTHRKVAHEALIGSVSHENAPALPPTTETHRPSDHTNDMKTASMAGAKPHTQARVATHATGKSKRNSFYSELSVSICAARIGASVSIEHEHVSILAAICDPDGKLKSTPIFTCPKTGKNPIIWDEKLTTYAKWDPRPVPGDYLVLCAFLGLRRVGQTHLKLGRDVKSNVPHFKWLPLAAPGGDVWQVPESHASGFLCVRVKFVSSAPFAFRKYYASGPRVRFVLPEPQRHGSAGIAACCRSCLTWLDRRREG